MSEKFEINRLARQFALGEVFYPEAELSASELVYRMGYSHDKIPDDLPVYAGLENYTGAELMNLVTEYEKGFKSMMQVAYDAGKAGKVLV
jgi:hypothetical protein